MSGQLSIFAPAPVAVDVVPDGNVLVGGAHASRRDGDGWVPMFPHRYVPARPAKVLDDADWQAMLDFAEDGLRWSQAPRGHRLDLSPGCKPNSPSGRGTPGRKSLDADSSGVAAYNWSSENVCRVDVSEATWPQVLAGLRERRDQEPEVARARDLAEAYHLLYYYGRVYGDGSTYACDDWSPVPLVEQIARDVLDLGGDPRLLEASTAYMAEGVARAAGDRQAVAA